ncbi:MAG TPA: DoxX-like family protein [Pyrinomonadaceae bacterium]|jgi:hypothetical protein
MLFCQGRRNLGGLFCGRECYHRPQVRLAKLLYIAFAAIWLVNGLVCKLLDLVPRHREIVARILGEGHSLALTRCIGGAEIFMAIWILSGIAPRLNAVAQIVVVLTMNAIEFALAPDLLLFGRLNAFVAVLFAGLVYYRAFCREDLAAVS